MLSGLKVQGFRTFVDLLRARTQQTPELGVFTFLTDGEGDEERITYAALDRGARAVAATLHEQGLTGAPVLLLYPPGLEFITALLGCFYAGAVAVPAYPPVPTRLARTLPRLQHILANSRATAILSTAFIAQMAEAFFEQAPDLRAARWIVTTSLPEGLEAAWRPPDLTPDSIAFLQYTSGSTGEPKGVMLTHANLLHNSALIAQAFEHTTSSVGVIWLPPYHDMGLIGGLLQPLYIGFHTVLLSPLDFLQRPLRWLKAVSRYRGRTSGGPNFAYELCVRRTTPEEREGLDLSSWALAFTGAEPVRAQTLRRFVETFAPYGFGERAFYPCYGLAEATLIVTGKAGVSTRPVVRRFDQAALDAGQALEAASPSASAAELVACGKVVGDQQVQIVNPENGRELGPGQIGEIWVCGSSVAAGYWAREGETERLFRARLAGSADGPYLRTGDLGVLIDGELFIVGRLKDLIIIRGRNIHPQDVERVAEESHPALRQGGCAAFAVVEEGEERLVLAQEVDMRRQPDLAAVAREIRRAVQQQNELLVHVLALVKPGVLPKTSSGKLQRGSCKEAFLKGELEVLLLSRLDRPKTPGALS